MPESTSPGTERIGLAASRYTGMAHDREPFLERARRLSILTIPSLFRDEGDNSTSDTIVAWNSIGAYGVNNLAAKLVLALFPPGRPFVKLKMDRKATRDLMQLPEKERGELTTVVNQGFALVEKEMVEAMDEDGDRARLTNAARKLLVGGNHGFQFYRDGTQRGIPLDRFVLLRDGAGNLLEFVVMDVLAWSTVPDDIKALIKANGFIDKSDNFKAKSIKVYTHGMFKDGKWVIYQEVFGMEVPDSRYTIKPEAMPFVFVPFILLEGESYGRSYVEDYEGDLQTVEGNTQAITEAGASIARFVQMVSPTGLTSKKTVAEAKNGDVITGRAEDVSTLQAEKGGDLGVVLQITQDATTRLVRAFLLNSSVVRQGERVTAEEIRQVAAELEESLGGVYSQAVVSWQGPFAKLKLRYLQMSGRITRLPEGSTRSTVIAGMAGIGRNAELQAIDDLLAGIGQIFGPEEIKRRVNATIYLKKRATALHVDTEGLIYTEEEVAANDQQGMMSGMAGQLAPEMVRQMGNQATATQVAETNAQSKLDVAALQQPAPQPVPTEGTV